jgi:hypothetical protein
MSRVKIRIELETQVTDYHGDSKIQFVDVYSQLVELKIPKSLIISISNRVNEFLQREIQEAGGQVL